MENEIKFYTTADVRRILGIGNKTCLDLFHRSDFPCIKVGKSFNSLFMYFLLIIQKNLHYIFQFLIIKYYHTFYQKKYLLPSNLVE